MHKERDRLVSLARRQRRAAAVDDAAAIVLLVMFVATGWWQGLRHDAVAWKAWLCVTILYLPMWLMAKSRR